MGMFASPFSGVPFDRNIEVTSDRSKMSLTAGILRFNLSFFGFSLGGGGAGIFLSDLVGMPTYGVLFFWAGVAVGMGPGLLFGVAWRRLGAAEHEKTVEYAYFLWGGCAVLILPIMFLLFPQMEAETRMVEALSQFDGSEVGWVVFYESDGRTEVLTLYRPPAMQFGRLMSDAVANSPSHPKESHTWHAILHGPVRYEIELYFEPRYPDSVFGRIDARSFLPDAMSPSVTFQSRALRPWIEENLMRGDAVE